MCVSANHRYVEAFKCLHVDIPIIPTFLFILGHVLAYLVLLLLTWLENVLMYWSTELWKVGCHVHCYFPKGVLLRINSKCEFVLLFLSKYFSSHFLLPLIPCRGALSTDLSLCFMPHNYAQMWVSVRTQNWLHVLTSTPAVLCSNNAYKTK